MLTKGYTSLYHSRPIGHKKFGQCGKELNVGIKNDMPLLSQNRVTPPRFHIKLGVIKQCGKALEKSDVCFNHISPKYIKWENING